MEAERNPPRVLTAYYKPKPGGLCKRYFRAIRALLNRGCVVHYLAVEAFPIQHANCHFHRLYWPRRWATSGASFWIWLHFAGTVSLAVLAVRYRVTHAFSFSINYGAMLLPSRVICRPRYCLVLRADSLFNNQLKGAGKVLQALEHCVESLALVRGHLVAVSDALLTRVQSRHRLARPSAAEVLRNDISSTQSRRGEIPTRPHIAFVGVLEARKNPHLLLDLAGVTRGQQLRWSIFGDGPQANLLRAAILERGLEDVVRMRGWAPMAEYWPSIDILLHPAMHEGAPNAVLEALGAGCVVFASDIPEHREILPSSMLLGLGDIRRWRQAVESLVVGESAWTSLRERANQCAQALVFDWDERIATAILGRTVRDG